MTLDLQEHINRSYPPTHTYSLEPEPRATEVLAERTGIMGRHFPAFFKGKRFLDIGCSKGYFCFAHRKDFEQITGIDSDWLAIDLCSKVARCYPGNYDFKNVSFRDFHDSISFDRIFIGNGPHHLYREIGSNAWINKLAALSSDLVLTEGPINIQCPDLQAQPDKYLRNYDSFILRMKSHFDLLGIHSTTRYTPERYLILWKRREAGRLGLRENGLIFKRFKHDDYVDNNQVDISIAASSPVSNGLVAFGEDGWYEKRCSAKPFKYKENQERLFKRHCLHQIYLSLLGYIDIDPGTINFFQGSELLFDKSGVMPIAEIGSRHIGAYLKLLHYSYDILSPKFEEIINSALTSKDPNRIKEAYEWLRSRF
ncbi:MAG TPA: class I SAM-dependent methyltransferase [candidate division Zixibacteria bacterium]|mgnify:CR=1 FL=1|nr:class I SAM-dependent methyltransferase [candidate division Zixibacteria bacterium]